MLRIASDMVQERPLFGHGAAWLPLWQERTLPGSLLSQNLTPHNEYLLVAMQVGALGLGLLVWALLAPAWSAARQGSHAELLAWTVLIGAGLFNALLRDARFALPLIAIVAFAAASLRQLP